MTAQDILQIRLIALQQANQPHILGDLLKNAQDIFQWLSKDVMKEEEERIVKRERRELQGAKEAMTSGVITPFGDD